MVLRQIGNPHRLGRYRIARKYSRPTWITYTPMQNTAPVANHIQAAL